MAQIQKGTTYVTGGSITALNINAHVDSAVLLPGAIVDQSAKAVPVGADSVLLNSVADAALRKTTLAEIAANISPAKLATARAIQLTGGVIGSTSFDGSADVTISTTLSGVSAAAVSDQANTSTGYFDVPSGTTGQRPGSPAEGNLRYNTTTGGLEFFRGTVWVKIPLTYAIEYLLIAGGGSGGAGYYSGGGGAGGVLAAPHSVNAGDIYAVVIGSGGAALPVVPRGARGLTGGNSSALGISAAGGGGGGSWNAAPIGGSGGSGGGNSYYDTTNTSSGVAGQGYSGAVGRQSVPRGGGGGGGGGGAPTGNNGGGGIGITWLNGLLYAGGGGGGAYLDTIEPGTAWAYGGGHGAGNVDVPVATAGAANTGGGGGGVNGDPGTGTSGAGGSGVFIVRYLGSQIGTGGTVTSSGGYTYHTFTGNGNYTA